MSTDVEGGLDWFGTDEEFERYSQTWWGPTCC